MNTYQQLLQEIEAIPSEFLPNFIQIARSYRQSVAPETAELSFRRGWDEALRGETKPINELWNPPTVASKK